jgi:galactoside O-acetyltransferase
MKIYGGGYLQSAELLQLGCRSVGNNVEVHSTCLLVGMENITFGNSVRVDAFSTLIAAGGSIDIGHHVHISTYVFLSGTEGIVIGDFVGFSAGSRVYSRNEDYKGHTLIGPTIPENYRKPVKGRVNFGRHVIIGAGSVILPNIEIGEGAAVGALSLVKSSLPPWGMYAGIPVKRIRDRDRTLLQEERKFLAVEGS